MVLHLLDTMVKRFSQWFADGTTLSPNVILQPGQVEETKELMEHPGSIDLSQLKFHAIPRSESYRLNPNTKVQRQVPDGLDAVETIVDIAIFPMPTMCAIQHNNFGCDMSKLGIGKTESYQGVSFNSLCNSQTGRLNIIHDYYHGFTTSIPVPINDKGKMSKHIQNKSDRLYFPSSSKPDTYYGIVIANCNQYGREVQIKGNLIFEYGNTKLTATQSMPTLYDVRNNPQYLITSIGVFILFVCCFIRIQILYPIRFLSSPLASSSNSTSAGRGQYQTVETAEEDDDDDSIIDDTEAQQGDDDDSE